VESNLGTFELNVGDSRARRALDTSIALEFPSLDFLGYSAVLTSLEDGSSVVSTVQTVVDPLTLEEANFSSASFIHNVYNNLPTGRRSARATGVALAVSITRASTEQQLPHGRSAYYAFVNLA
jgi:hypothetical protein